jgi:threonine dehydratase
MTELPTAADVIAAAERIRGHVHRTPLLRCRSIDEIAGRPVLLKAEHLQRTGSYKARGAMNHVLQLTEDERHRGVVAASSGNHGQAVAWAARQAGVPATVVVPSWIKPSKRAAIEGYGARMVVAGTTSDERLDVARSLVAAEGVVDIPPYDHARTIAGQGTWVAEAIEDGPPDVEAVAVPVSGGGLAAGTVLGVAAIGRQLPVVGVEPGGADDTRRSFLAGHRVRLPAPDTVADALRASIPGELTFLINGPRLHDVVVVEDERITGAMTLLAERAKQLVEPGGATALAAVLAGAIPGRGPVLVVLSGGNTSVGDLARLTGGGSVHPEEDR